jgi:hypothetical protein
MKHLHSMPRDDDAALVADALRPSRLLEESKLPDRRRTGCSEGRRTSPSRDAGLQ